ncbi:MAG: glycosyl hydrolase family protein [Ruminococcaceae bacterium]|nr:glycosyl hydrolase family protein [Oscillospiraceae bacterium]
MNIKRILSIILATIMVISVLSACTSSGEASVPASVDEEGKFIYAITRAFESSVEAEAGVKAIRKAIKDNFEVGITILRDSAIEDFDGNYEILVGDTNRAESGIAKERLNANRTNNANDFIVAVIEDKIVIQAMQGTILEGACEWFVNTFCQSLETWSMLKEGYEFIYEHHTADASYSNLVNNVDLGKFTIVLPVRTSYLVGMYAEDLVSFYKHYGYEMKSIEDIDDEVTNEIIIGDTTREASKAIEVEGDNYVIKVVDGDIVIKGGSDLATQRGVKALYDAAVQIKDGKGAINWSDGYVINGKYDAKEEGAFTLNWYDEFNGSTLDLNKWGEYSGMAKEKETSSLGGMKCWQTPFSTPYKEPDKLKKLIYVSGGNLHIGTQRLNEIDFVGGMLSTNYTMTFRYGVWEVHSKLPPVPCSLGYWLNESNMDAGINGRFGTGAVQDRRCFTEVDIIENFGSSTSFNANVHRWWTNNNSIDGATTSSGHDSLDGGKYSGAAKNNKKKVYDTERYEGDLSTDYHYYNMYWTDEFMKFSFDGKTYLDYQFDADPTGVGPYCLMTYFITECQMGDASYGATYDPNVHGNYYEHIIDYVRLYQSDSVNCQMITAWPQQQETGKSTIKYPDHPIGGTY